MKNQHYKWRKIDNFTNFYAGALKTQDFFNITDRYVLYNAKIKLHGTNAAIVLSSDQKVYAQKRSEIITPEHDNFDFAKYVKHTVEPLVTKFNDSFDVIIHGEWYGPGVQNGVACSHLSTRRFAIFAIETTEIAKDSLDHNENDWFVVKPELIKIILDNHFHKGIPDTFDILPFFYEHSFYFNLYDKESVESFLLNINHDVENIGECDPWIKTNFDIEGPGEGLVFYDLLENDSINNIFKAKSEAHRTVKSKTAAQIDPEKTSAKIEFVNSIVTEPRLIQGFDILKETVGDYPTMKNIPDFLRWVANDVQNECHSEMEANQFYWKDIAKYVNLVSVKWFTSKLKEI